MSEMALGRVGWVDLTVENATELRDFYAAVVGWSTSELSMGDYSDFGMHPAAGGDMVAGICHSRGENEGIPAQWLVYITVSNLDHSMDECHKRGGEVLAGPRSAGKGRFCVVRDPAGAVCALFEPISRSA
jgi:uncharacterized protein